MHRYVTRKAVHDTRRRQLLARFGLMLPAIAAPGLPGALLTGCGFRLRGSGASAGSLGRVFVDADRESTIARELTDALRARDLEIAADRDAADTLLRLVDENIDERVVSVQSTGRVSELELIHAVDLIVARAIDGRPPVIDPSLPGNRVRVAREYTYDETEVLGKANEERTLRRELRAELVRQIVLRTVASQANR